MKEAKENPKDLGATCRTVDPHTPRRAMSSFSQHARAPQSVRRDLPFEVTVASVSPVPWSIVSDSEQSPLR